MPDDTALNLAAQYWQLAQVSEDQFELRYVPNPLGGEPNEDLVREQFHEIFFSDAELKIVRAASIKLRDSGKLAEYVNEWMPVS
jgi:hypothetical protein